MTPDDSRWEAVLSRDPQADFVYAVATTRVYCRPSCPSRRPRREHVEYFSAPAAAERNGYRPCRRCAPGDSNRDPNAARRARVESACAALAGPEPCPSLAELADAVGATADTLRRDFQRVLGVTPKQYRDALRVEKLRDGLRDGRDVTGAMYDAGYGSSSRLYEQSDSRLGMTPASYGARGAGASITFATAASPLGRLLVATTERGVCRVTLGDDDAALERELRDEFSAAEVARDDGALAVTITEVLRRIDGCRPALELPVDLRGTAFQLQVWRELTRIPAGETRSYREVAESVGKPHAARAVGNACGSNPTAIVVPCHRVVASDGGLGGFGWGLDRKRLLLANEQQPA
jgi:AraC family transcriptional regulator, regulatory protein of adaptative response / methylated-DNA-[protein]-cysteine methyltransferase